MLYLIIIASNSQNKLSLWHSFWIWTGIMDIWIYMFKYFCMCVYVCIKYRCLFPCFKKIFIGQSKLSNKQIKLFWKLLRICIIAIILDVSCEYKQLRKTFNPLPLLLIPIHIQIAQGHALKIDFPDSFCVSEKCPSQ